MIINAIILKEKNIIINQLIPSPKMHISLSRINMMPSTPKDNNLQCELKLHINIEDEDNDKQTLATISLNYLIVAVLEDKDDEYEQNGYADKIFNVLQPLYLSEANKLLRESPFPPIPLNIQC